MYSVFVFIGLVFFLVFGVVFTRFVLIRFNLRVGGDGLDDKSIHYQFNEIDKLLEVGDAEALRIAVVEAGKLMDFVLREIDVKGDNYYEKLLALTTRIDREDVLRVYEINKDVFEGDKVNLTYDEALLVVDVYKRLIRKLKLL